MKKFVLLLSATFVFFAFDSNAQQMTAAPAPVQKSKKVETSALKPADATPYVFSSKEILEQSVPEKIEGLKNAILSGKYDDAQIKEMREQIWRFENAYVPQ